MTDHRFTRAERLKSRKLIGHLFTEGQSFAVYPLRIIFIKTERPGEAASVQAAFSVPKRHFRRAVERNRIRRLMREAYRLQKNMLTEKLAHTTGQFSVMVLYTAKEPLPYARIEPAMNQLVRRFLKKITP